jgi:hypothetical protein
MPAVPQHFPVRRQIMGREVAVAITRGKLDFGGQGVL